MLGFTVLLVSGLLLIFFGWGILASPYVLTVASLIPLGISLGIANEYFPQWKKAYAWFALLGIIAVGVSAIADLGTLKKISVPLFHGVAGLVIFLGPFFAKDAPKGFWFCRHRWCIDRHRRDCFGFPDKWIAIIVLQPGSRAPNPGPTVAANDLGFHIGFLERYPGRIA